MAQKKRYTPSRNVAHKFYWKIGLAALLALILLIVILELTNTTHLFHKTKIPSVIPSSSSSSQRSTSPSTNNPATPNTANSSSKSTSAQGGATGSNLALVAPYGNFVSNHHPSSSTSMDEVSVCNTTPGASCYIEFSNGQTTTKLATQVTDTSGSTSWSWNVNNDAHLTSSEWQITAVASLNGQTKSTADQLKLVVQ